MIGVVIPAHNEALLLPRALSAVRAAASDPALHGERVQAIVALDGCTDGSEAAARRSGAWVVRTPGGNVGAARAAGAALALRRGARWLAFTDADCEVAPDWLAAQLGLGCDAVCGTVQVQDWGSYGEAVRAQHRRTYVDADGHRHIHGANLGVSAAAYRGAGGFEPRPSGEDVHLLRALEASGARIAWSARPRVATSARRDHRAPGGFGAALVEVERRLVGAAGVGT